MMGHGAAGPAQLHPQTHIPVADFCEFLVNVTPTYDERVLVL